MTEDLPSFDPEHEAPATTPKPPRKPRRKPAKRQSAIKAKNLPAPKKARGRPRKQRLGKVHRRQREAATLKAGFKPEHAGGLFSKEVYDTIGKLMGMEKADRELVFAIVKGLNT